MRITNQNLLKYILFTIVSAIEDNPNSFKLLYINIYFNFNRLYHNHKCKTEMMKSF